MRKLILFAAALAPFLGTAQTITFETLSLPGNDTFYVNASHNLIDDGFNVGSVHFPYLYDTSFDGWSAGFSYTNKKDSVTSGYTNLYAAKAGGGFAGSDKYVTWTPGYTTTQNLYIPQNVNDTVENTNWFNPRTMYVTNTTYAYNAMRDGYFGAKKFGGPSGNDPDWFKLVVSGYKHRGLQITRSADSIVFYLADFRFANNTQDYIIKDWTMVDLRTLGAVDSLSFALSSSDNDPVYGMNTPAFFSMDNLTIAMPTSIENQPAKNLAKVYPNPATDHLFIEVADAAFTQASIIDVRGKLVASEAITGSRLNINTASFANGVYLLKLEGPNGGSVLRFVKQ